MAKFYVCEHCKNVIFKATDSGVPVVCCSEPMKELVAGTTDAAREKHVPVFEINGKTVSVKVGDVEHPMMEKHYIMWIALETNQGVQFKFLSPDDAPEATFAMTDNEEFKAVYAYCNLHSLWMAE